MASEQSNGNPADGVTHVHAREVYVHGGGDNRPPPSLYSVAIPAFIGGGIGGLLGALFCALLRHCGCG